MIVEKPLAGRRVLVVEDDYFVATDIKAQCMIMGAEAVTLVGTAAH